MNELMRDEVEFEQRSNQSFDNSHSHTVHIDQNNMQTNQAHNIEKINLNRTLENGLINHNEATYTTTNDPNEKKVRFLINDEIFQPSSETFTVDREQALNVEYRHPSKRISSIIGPGSMDRPDFEDALRRVAVVIHQHIITCTRRFERCTIETLETGQFRLSKMLEFSEENFMTPRFRYTFVRIPKALTGVCYQIEKLSNNFTEPTVVEIYDFMVTLFKRAELSSECSIVSLIYVERLMQRSHVPLTPTTWRVIVLCGLLLASKVWQDYSSWNVEFSVIYPQYSLKAINRLERLFVANIQWNLGIKSSEYAKYYFGLRSMTEKREFRQRYKFVMKVIPPTKAQAIEKRSAVVEMIFSKSL